MWNRKDFSKAAEFYPPKVEIKPEISLQLHQDKDLEKAEAYTQSLLLGNTHCTEFKCQQANSIVTALLVNTVSPLRAISRTISLFDLVEAKHRSQ